MILKITTHILLVLLLIVLVSSIVLVGPVNMLVMLHIVQTLKTVNWLGHDDVMRRRRICAIDQWRCAIE